MKSPILILLSIILSFTLLYGCNNSKEDYLSYDAKINNTPSYYKNSCKERNNYKISNNSVSPANPKMKINKDGNISLYKYAPYFNVLDKMYIDYYSSYDSMSKYIIKKYDKAQRKASDNPDFIISDYKDGVSIDIYNGKEKNLKIPSKLDGKKVIKIGNHIVDDEELFCGVVSPFDKIISITIPSTVKYISYEALNDRWNVGDSYKHFLEKIYVDKNNPYYTSIDGILYNKDKTCLLQIPMNYKKTTVSIPKGTKAVYCLNADTTKKIIIPSTVLSFGEPIDKNGNYDVNCDLPDPYETPLNSEYFNHNIKEFKVSKNNKYYASSDGVLYNIFKSLLLAYPKIKNNKSFTVPESVRIICNTVDFSENDFLQTIIFGKNIDRIDGEIGEFQTINGYKNTVAYKDAKEYGCKFVERK